MIHPVLMAAILALAAVLATPAPSCAGAEPSFREMFERHTAVMLLIDPANGAIVDANPAAEKFYRHAMEALRTMTIQEINALSDEQVAQELRLASSEGRTYFVFRHRLATGEIRTVEVRSHPYEFAGRTLLLSIVTDITPLRRDEDTLWHYQARLEATVDEQVGELTATQRRLTQFLLAGGAVQTALIVVLVITIRRRRDSERRFRDVSEAAGEYIWEISTDGRYRYVSDRSAEVLGYPPADLVGRTPFDFMPEDEARRVRGWFATALRRGRPFRGFQHRGIDGRGRAIWIEMNGLPVRRRGAVVGFRGAGMDITERKRAEAERERMLAALARSSEEMARLAEVTAHHFQEPSRRLVSYAQRLRSVIAARPDDTDSRLALDIIEREAMRLRSLVRDVQFYLAAGQADPESGPTDADAVLAHELRLMGTALEGAGAAVTADPLPAVAVGPRRLQAILHALLDNALRFRRPDRTPAIHLSAARRGDRVEFRVCDNGTGIPPAYRERVFRLFERLDGRPGNSGVGLSIVRRMVEAAGGTARIADSAEGGVCVVFDLPAAAGGNDGAAPPPSGMPAGAPAGEIAS
ncbi:sensor histidine kinase [Azospirillum halopraeferens]|uniref:sensor histidine kinase n=1 Tax=Azospirillum halopraeferens TaxID=34010 RepID=UPI0003F8B3D0|nr:PAS domain S-box protein [Azospirillum halopraeferens]